MALSPRDFSLQPGGKLIMFDPFHHETCSILFLLKQKFTWDNLPSSKIILMPKLPSTDLQNSLSTFTVLHITWFQWGNLPHSKRVALGPCLRNSLVFSCSSPSWSIFLDKMMESSFENSVTVPARWQYHVRLGQGFPEDCTCSELVSNRWYCFSHSQNSQIQGSSGGNGRGTPHHYS